MKKTFVAVVVLLAIVGIVLVGLRYRSARATASNSEYETVPVRRDTIVATVNASGTLNPNEQVSLTFPTGGLLSQMDVEAGQEVKVGEEIARLDTRQLELNIAQAEATLRTSEARLAQTQAGPDAADIAAAEAAVHSAQASLERLLDGPMATDLRSAELNVDAAKNQLWSAQAQRDAARGNPLSAQASIDAAEAQVLVAEVSVQQTILSLERLSDAPTAADVALAMSQLSQADAQLIKLQQTPTDQDLVIAEAQVAQAQAALEQARLRRDDAILTAPFDATVLAVNASVGELVSAAVPVVTIADLSSFDIVTSIDEADIGRVQVGQDARISLDAFLDVELRGRVTRSSPWGRVTQGVVSYDVDVRVQSTELTLRSNMTAVVDIEVERKEDVLVVPNRAVRRETGGRRYVEVLRGGEVTRRIVTTGLSNELVTEIVQGVSEGDQVVVSAPRENLLDQFGGFGFGGSN